MNDKVECECGHDYDCHVFEPRYGFQGFCGKGICECLQYDPAGHNPELVNILCPQCRKTRLEKTDRTYWCYACGYIMLEKQVQELTNDK